jgi:hypothetical protein
VPLVNIIEHTPRAANVTEALSVVNPEIYALVIEQVMVISDVCSLTIVTTSPLENVLLGIVIEPPDTTTI